MPDYNKSLLDTTILVDLLRNFTPYCHSKEIGSSMAILNDIGTLIIRSDDVRGGRPRIVGTGVTVRRIVGWYKLGLAPEEIVDRIGHLTLAQVYAALAYYHANSQEIEADIAAEEAEARQLEQKSESHVEDSG